MVLGECLSEEEWNKILGASLFPDILKLIDVLKDTGKPYEDHFAFFLGIETSEYFFQLQHRIADAGISYMFMMHFYNKGIPDKHWFISPGRSGSSVEYFPDFEDKHHEIKRWFDYYSDVFYYKLFSALDIIGHILNNTQGLKIPKDKVSFARSLEKLKGVNGGLYSNLNDIREDQVFKKASKIRNDITHNYLPSSVGFSVTVDKRKGSLGQRSYITSQEIINNVNPMLQLFKMILDCLSAMG